jgi:flagellum-specific peptidoglycan hydrolase FlgJ
MQQDTSFDLTFYLRKYWFHLSILVLVLYGITSKDFSFQFNINNPEIENSIKGPGNATKKGNKTKQELITQNNSKQQIAKSEASLFSKIPFIGGGSSTSKKSEWPKVEQSTVESYLKRFAHVAINERKKYGVPSSIILANALFHSFAGQRDMSQAGNNHFAIPCSLDWQGTTGTYSGNCYRHYENAWTSFRDHSLFVTSGKFVNLRQLAATDYKAWAAALADNKFSEFEDLEESLVEIIEKYGLHELDFK